MNAKNLLILVAVVVVVIIAFFVVAGGKPVAAPAYTEPTAQNPVPEATTTGVTTPAAPAPSTSATVAAPKHITITYGANGFSPANVSVPVGSTVTWVNQSGNRMWVASGQHPVHTGYDGTSVSQHCAAGAPTGSAVFDECTAGSSFSFTFAKVGTWSYHNHAQSSDGGVVTVTK